MKTLLLIAGILLLAACSDKPAEAPKPKEKVYNPWETQIKTLEQAKGLEQQMKKDAEAKDRKLREMGG
jgi:outer membrane biogenesis lipoprotein LolB